MGYSNKKVGIHVVCIEVGGGGWRIIVGSLTSSSVLSLSSPHTKYNTHHSFLQAAVLLFFYLN